MTGTEKQIACAQDLISKAIGDLQDGAEKWEAEAVQTTSERRRAVRMENANACRYAEKWLREKLTEEKYQSAAEIIKHKDIFDHGFSDMKIVRMIRDGQGYQVL